MRPDRRIPLHDHSNFNSGGRLSSSSGRITVTGSEASGGGSSAGDHDHSGFLRTIEGGQDAIYAIGNSSTAFTVDPTNGNVQTVTMTASGTATLDAPWGSGAATIELWVTEDGTGGRTITWPGSVTEEGTHTTTASTTQRVILETIDGGTSWIATWIGAGGSALTVEDEGTPLATAATTLDFVGAGVTASGTGAEKTITIPGPTAAAVSALGFVGELLISDTPSTPLVFADLIQNEAEDDLVYADI